MNLKLLYLSARDLASLNARLRVRGLTLLTPDRDARGAYLINALERLPVSERADALAEVRAWLSERRTAA